MPSQDPTTELKALTREHLRLVWQAAQMGGEQLKRRSLSRRCRAEAAAVKGENQP